MSRKGGRKRSWRDKGGAFADLLVRIKGQFPEIDSIWELLLITLIEQNPSLSPFTVATYVMSKKADYDRRVIAEHNRVAGAA